MQIRITTILTIATAVCLLSFMAAANSPSPYAGEQNRPIKAMSAEEQADLLAGRGMGLARAGELNSYPGPAHVLALKAELALDAQQIAATQKLFEIMQVQAIELGGEIVALEQQLDQGFAAGTIDRARLEQLTGAIALLQGRLRAAHLQAHLAMKRLLTPQQVASYDRLRGYGGMPMPGNAMPHQH